MIAVFLKNFLLIFLRFYSNYISYFFPAQCRFYPSCSHYAQGAVEEHGIIKGAWLSFIRLSKCHPWHEGGADPVPGKPSSHYTSCCKNHRSALSTNSHEDLL